MKLLLPKRQPGMPSGHALLAQLCVALDRSISGLRNVFLIAGLVAAATHSGPSADFLFVAGLLFQMAIWFEHWWITKRTR